MNCGTQLTVLKHGALYCLRSKNMKAASWGCIHRELVKSSGKEVDEERGRPGCGGGTGQSEVPSGSRHGGDTLPVEVYTASLSSRTTLSAESVGSVIY